MRLSATDLDLCWTAATRRDPVVIIGAGRWGRVWAGVLAAARGDGAGTTIVARGNFAETGQWVDSSPSLAGMKVADSIAAAFAATPRPGVAIVASRPRDHVADALEALAGGAHVLVEKPLAACAAEARRLLDAAVGTGRLVGIGTEFALHPAIHHFAALLEQRLRAPFEVRLDWTDPTGETRHGSLKADHEEITILDDLLPHALSIYRVIAPEGGWTLAASHLSPAGRAGRLELRDRNGSTFVLSCDGRSDRRRRLLRVETGKASASIDFAADPARIIIDGVGAELSGQARALTSTLRLEIGAFLAEAADMLATSPLTSGLAELVELQAAVERECRGQCPNGPRDRAPGRN